MSIKRMFLAIFASFAFLLAVLAGITVAILDNQVELSKSEETRFQSYLAADELRQNSDDLTRMARTYVVGGIQTSQAPHPAWRRRFRGALSSASNQ